MDEYIRRDEAINVALTYRNTHDMTLIPGSYMTGFKCGAELREYDIVSGLQILPAADVVPVVHAEWIISTDGYYPYCSACKKEPPGRCMTAHCPNCGARMDKEEKDELPITD